MISPTRERQSKDSNSGCLTLLYMFFTTVWQILARSSPNPFSPARYKGRLFFSSCLAVSLGLDDRTLSDKMLCQMKNAMSVHLVPNTPQTIVLALSVFLTLLSIVQCRTWGSPRKLVTLED